ncbi:hypothetical protein BU24DRAFT_1984 [Aaosphaeria arxii CBS 175.79]|uniref:Uncharacterized protein n=1 Tax=Aaosphaeria arxii CBS 175.79 TaxID=1450172 RepID=A0A6A5Y6V5_9PLEO|nr:uncharacterized protein BU24DRAFT_1984 [Aaosphaeria arxii CBS 175.79]KAF2020481.1 hypothetical protein BU24DRAFT_1984 [Aaosphaeria arxii CBS 175.79]
MIWRTKFSMLFMLYRRCNTHPKRRCAIPEDIPNSTHTCWESAITPITMPTMSRCQQHWLAREMFIALSLHHLELVAYSNHVNLDLARLEEAYSKDTAAFAQSRDRNMSAHGHAQLKLSNPRCDTRTKHDLATGA